jgi:hypothetical protein
VQIAIAILAAATVYITNDVGVYGSALATAIAALLWAWFDWHYKEARGQAERVRRATLIMDGLGTSLSPSELKELKARFTATPEEGEKLEDPAYYAATAPPGPARLAEMLDETAFWSCHLLRHSANRAWFFFSLFHCLLADSSAGLSAVRPHPATCGRSPSCLCNGDASRSNRRDRSRSRVLQSIARS